MILRLLIYLYSILVLLTSMQCNDGNVKEIQVVFFDLNEFDKTDTLSITNGDTIRLIKGLFENMIPSDVKFPRRYQITFIRERSEDVYYSNGLFVRVGKQSFKLPSNEGLEVFKRQLRVMN